jgi:hypothetical protein
LLYQTVAIPPSARVQFILGEEGEDDGTHESHPLFSEMEELQYNTEGGEAEWNETARSVASCRIVSARQNGKKSFRPWAGY